MSGILNQLGARSGEIGKTEGAGVPLDVVAYRASSASTPEAWSEYTSARGRMVVGLPGSGTDGGTVGTALTNAQDKSKSIAHTHTSAPHYHNLGYLDYWSTGQIRNSDHPYGTDGTYGNDHYTSNTGNDGVDQLIPKSESITPSPTGAINTGVTAVVTSDVLAYIQLMVIKKD